MKFDRTLEKKTFSSHAGAMIHAKKAIAYIRASYAADSEDGDESFTDSHLEFTTSGGDAVRADWEFASEDLTNKSVILTISSRY